jgi:hypothetical protein
MRASIVGDRPQAEKYFVSDVAKHAVFEGDRKRFKARGRDQLQPDASWEQPHKVTIMDDFDGSVFVT